MVHMMSEGARYHNRDGGSCQNGHEASTKDERTPLTQSANEGIVSGKDDRPNRRVSSERSTFRTSHVSPDPHVLYIPQKENPCKDKTNCTFTVVASVLALALCLGALCFDASSEWKHTMQQSQSSETAAEDLFDDIGRYMLEDYDAQTPFSDSLPGLAGIYGKPLYAFFVNRGQGIAAFGVESKDYPILEFNSANKAYQNTPLLGFRTFIQGTRKKNKKFLLEPFSPLKTNHPATGINNMGETTFALLPKRIMYTGENELQIQEIDFENQLETNVTYFILPEEDFGAFARRTTITNTHPKESLTLSVLDGLARLEPAGGKMNANLKFIGRTIEAWMGVYFPSKDSITMPFYRLSTEPKDTASIKLQERGHYCLGFLERNGEETESLLPIVFDTDKVFGEDTTLLRPVELFSKSVGDIVNGPQYGKAKTSSCFAAVEEMALGPGETVTISTFYGAADHISQVPGYARRVMQENFVQYKLTRSREVIRQITKSVNTHTKNHLFDAHVEQMFLDNSLRGGIPMVLGDQDDDGGILNVDEDPRLKVFHVFSRIHGDLERDYNDFMLSPTFFSAGPGNFRDVAQNRRDDVVFNPRIGSSNVRTFLSFIQADGYEPQSIEPVVFTIRDKEACDQIAERAVGRADGHRAQREALSSILNTGAFRPGQLFELLESQNVELIISRQQLINMVAISAESSPMAVYETGFWADHWTYYLDMIKSYLSIYPDGEQRLLYDEQLPFFFSPAHVQPRSKKYVLKLSLDSSHHHVQQLYATVHDKEKKEYMDQFMSHELVWYKMEAHWQDDEEGPIFKSSAVAKLVLLATLKFATRDAYGMAIEYEGGRPGWDDANNGLSGMLGSGMPETFELKALLDYLLQATRRYRRPVVLPLELFELIDSINKHLDDLDGFSDEVPLKAKVPSELFEYWDGVATAREEYREKVKIRFSGMTSTLAAESMERILERWLDEVDLGISRAMSMGTEGFANDGESGIIPTYFAYNVTKWRKTGENNTDGHPLVTPLKMAVRKFPLFLEGPTRMMKTVDAHSANEIYQRVRQSGLHDDALSMYTMSASLKGQPIDIGRAIAFPAGWLENQSVWLHMSYKFYLELLRHNLHEDFYSEVGAGGILPFMDPKIYGRSLMECSSFIASSAFEDPSKHGRGFQARLSGATAEFLSMWIFMFIGSRPYYLDEKSGELRLQLIPSLPSWLFETEDENGLAQTPMVRFRLFSSIYVRYYNEGNIDLFGAVPRRYRIGLRDGRIFEVDEPSIPFHLADKIRRVVFVDFIEAYFF